MILAGVQVSDRNLIAAAIRNVRPLKRPTRRWALVRDTFNIASTMAYAMCREFKLDPEETLNP